jgi:hypothetical protein
MTKGTLPYIALPQELRFVILDIVLDYTAARIVPQQYTYDEHAFYIDQLNSLMPA